MVKIYKYINNLILVDIILLISILKRNDCAIYILFKIIEPSIRNNFYNASSILEYWNNTKLSTELSIGNPPQKNTNFIFIKYV